MRGRIRDSFWAVLVAGLLAVGCGSDDAGSPAVGTGGSGTGGIGGTGGTGYTEASSVLLYGELGSSDLELYPSDRYTRADASTETGLRVDLSLDTVASESQLFSYGVTLDQLNELDGFSTAGGVTIKFSSPLDVTGVALDPENTEPATAPLLDAAAYTRPGAPMYLVDVDPASPDRGQAVGLIPVYFAQAGDEYWQFDDYTLIAQPERALRPKTRYHLVVTNRLKAADGTPIGRSRHMHDVLGGGFESPYVSGMLADLEQVEQAFELQRDEVVAATSFTTASVQRGLVEAAKVRREAPAPAVTGAWTVHREDAESVRFVNNYPAPEYRRAPPNGKWDIDPSGAPKIQSTPELEFFLSFSKRDVSGPRPVVIYGHGLGGDKDGDWGTAGRLDAIDPSGVAVFSLDSPEHGSRSEDETTLISSAFGFFGIDPDSDEFDIGRARDNFRQMAMDQLELVRLINTLGSLDVLPAGAPDGVPDLDVSRILYIGHSFGSVQGATIAALAPEIKHVNWNVGGASLMMLLRDSNTFSLVVSGLAPDGTPFGSIAGFLSYTQAIVDPGDPINYARNVSLEPLEGVSGWAARDILIQEVVPDGIVPNSTTEMLARSAGLDVLSEVKDISGLEPISGPVTGNLSTGATGVISQFDRVEGGTKAADHGGLIFTPEAMAQYQEFFRTGLESGRSTVPHPYP